MEGLIKRCWILAAIVLACGAFTKFVPPPRSKPVDELWMTQRMPNEVDGLMFHADPSAPPGQSYKMGQSTYDTLEPSGIAARIYTSSDKAFDVVLIASDNSKSFHDPRVCFTASGYNIVNQQQVPLHTKTRGDIPMTFVKMSGVGTTQKSALYGYRGPSGFVSVARKMRLDMMLGQLLHARNEQGVFYRFIPMSDNISDQELQEFAADFLDSANQTSQGFF